MDKAEGKRKSSETESVEAELSSEPSSKKVKTVGESSSQAVDEGNDSIEARYFDDD